MIGDLIDRCDDFVKIVPSPRVQSDSIDQLVAMQLQVLIFFRDDDVSTTIPLFRHEAEDPRFSKHF